MKLDDIMLNESAVAVVESSLREDIGSGDVTTLSLVNPEIMATGEILAREACVVAGVNVACKVLELVDPDLKAKVVVADGERVASGEIIISISGSAASILTAERTALNFMQRMCGIATLTRQFVDAVHPLNTVILDTRKTTPTLRAFEKYSVLCGGGTNHRFGLYDRVLVKDNHRKLWEGGDPDRLDLAVEAARKAFPEVMVEMEVESVEECKSALRAAPEWIMLDNMSCEMMRECVDLCRGITQTEASGGITLDKAREVAETGVDAISLGCLTHSARAVDLSLEWSVV
ncbi:MAG: carboxylating nicotinate-nucleotide diphosphorylase [Kiritimatiellae bacterium]|jgi:nicotinate-nucleotide pyrophosphorylase (carboxylating)|nr:carboxylating nicotinate-nucleotide diphosphorylase [Kiritimatiellia bacterium]